MLKPIDPDSTIKIVYPLDDALESDETAVAKYMQGPFQGCRPDKWRDFFTVKDGHHPTEFVVGIIPSSELARIEDDCKRSSVNEEPLFSQLYWRAFLASVREIENGPAMDIKDANGRRTKGTPKIDKNGTQYVDPDWLRDIFVGPLFDVAKHVGGLAYRWQSLTEEEAKK